MATKDERIEIELLKLEQSHMNEKIDKNHTEVLDKFDKIEKYIIKQNDVFATKKDHAENQEEIKLLKVSSQENKEFMWKFLGASSVIIPTVTFLLTQLYLSLWN